LERTIAYFDRLLSGEARGRKATRKKPAPTLKIATPSLTSVEDSALRVNNVQR